jgi:hypothetical protein
MGLRTPSALTAVLLASVVALAGCGTAEHGDPITATQLADMWSALGGNPDDTTSGAAFTADELPAIEPAECALIELVRSGAPYTVDDSTVEDPGMAGNLASPSAALEAGANSDPTQEAQWYATARVFPTDTAAADYMQELEVTAPGCATYTTSFDGEEPTTTALVLTEFDTGELPSVGLNEAVVLQKDNVAFVLWPVGGVEDVQADLNAFVNILER